ncbi:hypothetical protein [Dyadobacter diqingensis]|uniref:hypothetical protein n=1 Tax=Dyadobacter diqingensis TaxID=2938121 RepID=UPI0020C3CE9E|nr:hypothetical protein [Dyadobacter diqingensis]
MHLIEDNYCDWPGWNLKNNKFGDEFDKPARIRMIEGSRKLIPYILKYQNKFSGSLCEIGPFFNPLLAHSEVERFISNRLNITFLENDRNAVEFLTNKFMCQVLDVDLNVLTKNYFYDNLPFSSKLFDGFDVVIISQVLNYVNFRALMAVVFEVLKNDGIVFINNSLNYGIPQLFSEKRPKSDIELIDFVKGLGFIIIEEDLLDAGSCKELNKRLILTLGKKVFDDRADSHY